MFRQKPNQTYIAMYLRHSAIVIDNTGLMKKHEHEDKMLMERWHKKDGNIQE